MLDKHQLIAEFRLTYKKRYNIIYKVNEDEEKF